VNIVKLPLKYSTPSERAAKALSISHWLQRECGLMRDTDFDWSFMTKENEVHFRFYSDNNEAMESILLMRWL
jgi:hypothetical protein